MEQIYVSEEYEREFDQEYPFSSESDEEPVDRSRSRDTSGSNLEERGTIDVDGGGDRSRLNEDNLDEGWEETFTEPRSSSVKICVDLLN